MKRVGMLLSFLVVACLLVLFSVKDRNGVTIGVVQFTDNNLETLEGFRQQMVTFGYVEGDSIEYVFEGPAQSREAIEGIVRRVMAEDPDLIFASTTPAAKMASDIAAEQGVPVVFGPVNDPVASGIVRNVQRPEGNVTGVRLAPSEGRRLQVLVDLDPAVRRVLVPYNPGDRSAEATLAQLEEAAPVLGVELVEKPFSVEPPSLEESGYVPEDVDAIFMPREGLVMSRHEDFAQVAMAHGLLLSSPRLDQVRDGVLTGYGFVGFEVGRQAARLAHRILQGTPVADLPVETAQDYIFINMDTAAAMGFEPPSSFVRSAKYIIRNGTVEVW